MKAKFVKLGMFTALAMALQWAETLIPVGFSVPGGKLGLANIITMIVMQLFGGRSALAVTVIRCLLSAFLYGGVMSLPYSLAGGIMSLALMKLVLKLHGASLTGAAIAGAFAHNFGQVLVSCIIMQNIYIINYLWVLGFVSVGAGAFTGICASLCLKKISLNKGG